ncbi:MAG TPA: cation-transporting P-type ATPase, partial [Verrucomicrobiae bacterium]
MPVSNGLNQQATTDLLREVATQESAAALEKFRTNVAGLSEAEVETRLLQYGPNEVAQEKKHSWLWRLWIAALNPLVILLSILAIIEFATANAASDYIGGSVMVIMVLLGLSLRFIQETKADTAAAKLKAMIKVTATVLRDGQPKEIPLKDLVPGDVVKLSAGDMIPGDVRLLTSKDLFVIQATLTGESLPVEKT